MRIFQARLEARRGDTLPVLEGMLFGLSRSGELAVGVGPSIEGFLVRGTLGQVNLGGGAPRELLEDVTAADWSPDGRLAAVAPRAAGHGSSSRSAPSSTRRPAGSPRPRFAPSGDAIAFHEHPLHGDDRGWPALVDLRSGTKRNLAPEFETLSGLAWRPDGSEVCFAVASPCAAWLRVAARHDRCFRARTASCWRTSRWTVACW